MNHLTTEITPSNIRLQVGKSYRSRNGEIVKIIDDARGRLAPAGRWPFLGDNDRVYRENGHWLHSIDGDLDLIEEIAE
jgi:hypothetical protein